MERESVDSVTVVIPVKGHSTRVPRKNLAEFRGVPLLFSAIQYTQQEGFTPTVLTDDLEMADYARRCGAEVLMEPEELIDGQLNPCADWVMQKTGTDVVMLQATGPIRPPNLLYRLAAVKAEAAITVCKLPVQIVCDKHGRCVNGRFGPGEPPPFSQEFVDDPHWMFSGHAFLKRRSLIGTLHYHADPALVEVPWQTAVDIDEPEDFQAPSVVVVGNASSLRNVRVGWQIDRYDVVVRLNHYWIEGFEPYVGSKTTHWCRGTEIGGITAYLNSPEERWRCDASGLVEVWLRMAQVPEAEETARLDAARGQMTHVVQERVIDAEGFFDLANDAGEALKPDFQPMTGLVAICHALDRWGPPIDVAGFGHRDHSEAGYYYGDSVWPMGAWCHDPDAERRVLNWMEDKGLVRRLD